MKLANLEKTQVAKGLGLSRVWLYSLLNRNRLTDKRLKEIYTIAKRKYEKELGLLRAKESRGMKSLENIFYTK